MSSLSKVACAALVISGFACALLAQKVEPSKPDKADPDKNSLYVWSIPESGLQSMLVLKVVDQDTFEAALLVPVNVSLDYSGGNKLPLEQLRSKIDGKLVPVKLTGRDRFGRITGDVKTESGWLTGKGAK